MTEWTATAPLWLQPIGNPTQMTILTTLKWWKHSGCHNSAAHAKIAFWPLEASIILYGGDRLLPLEVTEVQVRPLYCRHLLAELGPIIVNGKMYIFV